MVGMFLENPDWDDVSEVARAPAEIYGQAALRLRIDDATEYASRVKHFPSYHAVRYCCASERLTCITVTNVCVSVCSCDVKSGRVYLDERWDAVLGSVDSYVCLVFVQLG